MSSSPYTNAATATTAKMKVKSRRDHYNDDHGDDDDNEDDGGRLTVSTPSATTTSITTTNTTYSTPSPGSLSTSSKFPFANNGATSTAGSGQSATLAGQSATSNTKRIPSDGSSGGVATKSSTKQLDTTRDDAILKAKPNFPSSAPLVFRSPTVDVITRKMLENTQKYTDVGAAIKGLQLFVTPPRIYVRQIGYRYEGDFTPMELGAFRELCDRTEAKSPLAARTNTQTQDTTRPSEFADDTALDNTTAFGGGGGGMGTLGTSNYTGKGKKVKILDVKTELTEFVDSDFLLYNPDHISSYCQDDQHAHKSIQIFKYVASSRLKQICNSLRTKWEHLCDAGVDIKISNDDYSDRMPKEDKLMFDDKTCAPGLLLCVLPFLFPLYLYERAHTKTYECGFVYRIKKRDITAIERELIKQTEKYFRDNGIVIEDGSSGSRRRIDDSDSESGFKESSVKLQLKTSGRIEAHELDNTYNQDILKRVNQVSTV